VPPYCSSVTSVAVGGRTCSSITSSSLWFRCMTSTQLTTGIYDLFAWTSTGLNDTIPRAFTVVGLRREFASPPPPSPWRLCRNVVVGGAGERDLYARGRVTSSPILQRSASQFETEHGQRSFQRDLSSPRHHHAFAGNQTLRAGPDCSSTYRTRAPMGTPHRGAFLRY